MPSPPSSETECGEQMAPADRDHDAVLQLGTLAGLGREQVGDCEEPEHEYDRDRTNAIRRVRQT